jgi:hypothetical protein
MDILEESPEFEDVVHSFVGNIDIKKQFKAIRYLAKKRMSSKLCTYIRNHPEILSTVSTRYEEMRISSNRLERVIEFHDLLTKVKEGDNAGIRVLRGTDPHLTSGKIRCIMILSYQIL